MRKAYATLDCAGQPVQTHYRTTGQGPPLVLLHPSPLSSVFMAPLMELWAGDATLFAPDTPGYGQSDALPEAPVDLVAYVDWLRRLLDAWGLERTGLYGSATGAQIAIEFARAHPGRLSYLVVENAVHFSDEERAWILRDYFPSLAPQADGSHLQLAWHMADALFRRFPWFDESEQARVDAPTPPVELVHGIAMGYLQAGPDYHRAYRAAFENEDARKLQAVTVPTYVVRWAGSLLRRYADRLDQFDWPPNVHMVRCGPAPDERLTALGNLLQSLHRQA
jgi:pimeloyl-ACP methyl ester carboxylesterase